MICNPTRIQLAMLMARQYAHHSASATMLLSVPMPAMSILTVSPLLRKTPRVYPTPAGVPVRITVPGNSVVSCDRNAMISGTVRSIALVLPS